MVLLVSGAPGAGKSSVAEAIHGRLSDQGVANALLEADQLRRCDPPLPDDVLREHVRLLAEAYRRAGYDVLIGTETVEDADLLRQFAAALQPGPLFLVRLDADPSTCSARVRARERSTWPGLPALLAAAERLASSMRSLPHVDLVVRTEGQAVEDAATEVLAAFDQWRERAAASL